MTEEQTSTTRRMDREIANFEGQAALHQHGAAFHYRNEHFVGPAIASVFGLNDVAGVYAESIARAIARSGLGHAISLGCGDGSQEIAVLRRADALGLPPFRIIGVDVAPGVVTRANEAASSAGLADRLTAVVADANGGLPGDGPIAAIMVHHALHHFVALESLLDGVAARLHPEGAFVTFDMIGRNGHMRWPEVRPLVRRLWAMLPREKRYDHYFHRDMPFFQDWDCAIEGFEGVRAQDILGVIATRFRAGRFVAWGGLSEVFVNPRMAANLDIKLPADTVFLTAVMQLEQRLLESRRTTPTEMVAEFRSLHTAETLDPMAEAAFRRALRHLGETFESLADLPFASPYPPQPGPDMPLLEHVAFNLNHSLRR
ncbi:MAG: class I SAM-dependent methyltransferase [Rhodobacter sp.]|jgi:SAM-dependent methyltransferase|nr:class I SAM-dependent methyltransferase [Rhodobacter sp.]